MRISDWSSDVCSSDLAIIVAKVNAAEDEQVERAEAQARDLNPSATIIRGASPVVLDDPEQVRGKRVLVVDDGPTLTHGGMAYGARSEERRVGKEGVSTGRSRW